MVEWDIETDRDIIYISFSLNIADFGWKPKDPVALFKNIGGSNGVQSKFIRMILGIDLIFQFTDYIVQLVSEYSGSILIRLVFKELKEFVFSKTVKEFFYK